MTTTTHAQGYASANALIIFSSIYVWPLALFATFMLIVHSWLALTNSTTFEITKGGEGGVDYLKGTKECDLPFSNVSGGEINKCKYCPRSVSPTIDAS